MNKSHQISTTQLTSLLVAAALMGVCFTILVANSATAPAGASIIQSAVQKDNEANVKPASKANKGRPVVHFEIGCQNTAKTKEFYSKLFDWQINGEGAAAVIQTGAGSGIDGHITALGHDPQHYVTFYTEVEDIKASLERATALGGKKIVGPVKIPTGQFAWFSDPDGNIIGLLQSKKP